MSRWMELAQQLESEGATPAKIAKIAKTTVEAPQTGGFGNNGNFGTGSVPPSILAGLTQLATMPAPRITSPEVWPEIVSDARRLLDERWAAQALALGWEPLQLWGCSPAPGGDADLDSLAVRMAGRRIVLLDEHTAILESGAGTHHVFTRRPMDGAVYLWELGSRGR